MMRVLKRWCVFSLLLVVLPVSAGDKAPVRLAVVHTPWDSELIQSLVADFSAQSDYQVEISHGSDVLQRAQDGRADIIIAHYGKKGLDKLVTSGRGSWPQLVFANQQAIIGPADDPANVREQSNASEALAAIAQSGSPFVSNAITGVEQLTHQLLLLAGEPAKKGWFMTPGVSARKAMQKAESEQAYTLWGAIPFLEYQRETDSSLVILHTRDPLLQRLMASVRITDEDQSEQQRAGAQALEQYLLSAPAQLKISNHRSHGVEDQLWWPAARHNSFH